MKIETLCIIFASFVREKLDQVEEQTKSIDFLKKEVLLVPYESLATVTDGNM